jgi:hypothetical protein
MKVLYSLVAIAILCSSSLAASATDVNLFVSNYLGENETFTKTPFNLSDAQYYIINISEPSFLLRVPSNGSITMITDKTDIRNALTAYYASQGITKEELKLNQSYVDELLSLVDAYNKTREKEFECKTYIGIDRFPCVDLDTCWRACYTPICQQIKIGAGRPFLELIWSFSNLSSYIDSNISTFKEKLASTTEFTSPGQFDELTLSIENMKNDSIAIDKSDMFNPLALGFCHSVDYNLTYLTQAEIKLLTKRDEIMPLITVDDTADRIYNNTMQRISLKSQFGIQKLCSSLLSNNSKEFSLIKANLSKLNTSGMTEKLNELEDASRLSGCSKMDEIQIRAAQMNYSSLSNQAVEYANKLEGVVKLKDEVSSSLAGMQGDILLSFNLGGLNSKLSDISARIDPAGTSQLQDLESQLLGLKTEVSDANNNKFLLFISGIITSPLFVISVVLVLVIFLITKPKKKRK